MHLTGARQHNLDAKMRLTLPADIRREFHDKVCLVPLPDALYGFTPEGHEAWVDSYFPEGKPMSNAAKMRRMLNGRTVTVDVDSAGRVALGKVPAPTREKLGLLREVMVVGNGDHFEVWNQGRWEAQLADLEDEFETLLFGDE